ncbi:MAG TPA: alginate export family protein [Lacipirellulaceae bacterium]|nr:alginate export family protein [Lacipirellulaceae bacterium]
MAICAAIAGGLPASETGVKLLNPAALSACSWQDPPPAPAWATVDDALDAADAEPPSAEPAESSEESSESPEPEKRSYYVEARSVGTRRETEPPRYVRALDQVDLPLFENASWCELGLDYRMRFEYRDDDFRRPVEGADYPFLLRTRGYLGFKDVVDPLRGYIEFEDARRYNSQFPLDNRDTNLNEIIQAVAELHFADALGPDRPLRMQVGRFAFEYTDRRLIARNEWRNTTNNFQGFRTILGQQDNDWQLDLLALQPMERLLSAPDRVDEERWFYGFVGDWRRWSQVVTLQPYFLVLDQNGKDGRPERNIYTTAVRGYGIIGDSGYDFDFDVAYQFGRDDSRSHRAFGVTGELGYTWDHEMKPRLCAFCGYASGDRDPFDDVNQRFDRLFGFARPWSADDYFLWENLIAPKVRLDFIAGEKWRFDMGYGVFWLASATDSWAGANLRDPTGQSGDFMGHELDVRIRVAATKRVDLTLGYAHFIPGAFTRNVGRRQDSDFFYVEVSPRLLK